MAFIIHRSSYCGGRSTQLQRNGTNRLHWRVTLQLYIDGYTAKRKRESWWASVGERACMNVRFRLCVRRNAKWTRHAAGRGLSRGSPTFSFFFMGGSVLLDDSFNFLGRTLPLRRCFLFFLSVPRSGRVGWPRFFSVSSGNERRTERRKSKRDKKSSARCMRTFLFFDLSCRRQVSCLATLPSPSSAFYRFVVTIFLENLAFTNGTWFSTENVQSAVVSDWTAAGSMNAFRKWFTVMRN